MPLLLVGTKSDLREADLREDASALASQKSNSQTAITKEQAQTYANELGAVSYLECSALTQDGLTRVFEEAACAALSHQEMPHRRGGCCLLH